MTFEMYSCIKTKNINPKKFIKKNTESCMLNNKPASCNATS